MFGDRMGMALTVDLEVYMLDLFQFAFGVVVVVVSGNWKGGCVAAATAAGCCGMLMDGRSSFVFVIADGCVSRLFDCSVWLFDILLCDFVGDDGGGVVECV